jgi:hypothetical protein
VFTYFRQFQNYKYIKTKQNKKPEKLYYFNTQMQYALSKDLVECGVISFESGFILSRVGLNSNGALKNGWHH